MQLLFQLDGIYTMNAKEAANLVNEIRPQIAIPIHYGSIVGSVEDAREFSKLLDSEIKCEILMKQKSKKIDYCSRFNFWWR